MQGDYRIEITEKVNDPEWDDYVAGLPCGHHVQTSLWGRVKRELDYHTLRLVVRKEEAIVAGGQVLTKQISPLMKIGCMPKGPLFTKWEPELVNFLLQELRKLISARHFILFAMQPAWEEEQSRSLFIRHGFQPGLLELAPTATILLDLGDSNENILAQMKRQTRQNVHRSEREGLTIREGNANDLPTFYKLLISTSCRQNFKPYTEAYFAKMWEVFSAKDMIGLIIAERQGSPISALLLVDFGKTVVSKTLGWSGQNPECRPNDAAFWGAIQWAKKRGCQCFDFEGINREGAELILKGLTLPEHLQHSPDFLKLGYGGKVTLMPQSYSFIPNPIIRWSYNRLFGLNCNRDGFIQKFDQVRRALV